MRKPPSTKSGDASIRLPSQELRDVTELWVETALRLTEQDLRKMAKLAAAQTRLRLRQAAAGALAAA